MFMSVYVYVYVYVYVCICMYMYLYVCMCMYVYVCVCMCMYVYVCVCMCMYVYVCVCMCMYVYVCVCMCMYVCMYVCIYIYIYWSTWNSVLHMMWEEKQQSSGSPKHHFQHERVAIEDHSSCHLAPKMGTANPISQESRDTYGKMIAKSAQKCLKMFEVEYRSNGSNWLSFQTVPDWLIASTSKEDKETSLSTSLVNNPQGCEFASSKSRKKHISSVHLAVFQIDHLSSFINIDTV